MIIQVGSEQFCGRDHVPQALRSTPTTAIIKLNKKSSTSKTWLNLYYEQSAVLEKRVIVFLKIPQEMRSTL